MISTKIQYKESLPEQREKAADRDRTDGNTFDCNICLDQAKDPVVTLCGHLYCWSCLRRWLEIKHACPVCKNLTGAENVVPLYGRGSDAADGDPRPEAHRTEPRPSLFIPAFGNGLHVTLELGHFLFEFFTVFTLMRNLNLLQPVREAGGRSGGNLLARLWNEAFFPNLFLWLALAFLAYLFAFSA